MIRLNAIMHFDARRPAHRTVVLQMCCTMTVNGSITLLRKIFVSLIILLC